MAKLGPCPRCGGAMQTRSWGSEDGDPYVHGECTKCDYASAVHDCYADFAEEHNQLSEHAEFYRRWKDEPVEDAVELLRLLEWAKEKKLVHATTPISTQVDKPIGWENGMTEYYRLAEAKTLLEALRKAKKTLEATNE